MLDQEGEITSAEEDIEEEIVSPAIKKKLATQSMAAQAVKITYKYIVQPSADVLTPTHIALGTLTILSGFEGVPEVAAKPMLYTNLALMLGGALNTFSRVFEIKRADLPRIFWEAGIDGFGTTLYTGRLAIAIYDFVVTQGKDKEVFISNTEFGLASIPFILSGIMAAGMHISRHLCSHDNQSTPHPILENAQKTTPSKTRQIAKHFPASLFNAIEVGAQANLFISNIYISANKKKELESINGAFVSFLIPAIISSIFLIVSMIAASFNQLNKKTIEKGFHIAGMLNMGLLLSIITLGSASTTFEGEFLDDNDRTILPILLSIPLLLALLFRPMKTLQHQHQLALDFAQDATHNERQALILPSIDTPAATSASSQCWARLFSCQYFNQLPLVKHLRHKNNTPIDNAQPDYDRLKTL